MPYHNTYTPLGNISSTAPKVGGWCGVTLFKWEDVQTWPAVNPLTGVLSTALQLKAGASFYSLAATEKDKLYHEVEKSGSEGTYTEVTISAKIMGSNAGIALILDKLKYHMWGMIINERTGDQRLVGDSDSAARFLRDYDNGSYESSRFYTLNWSWQSPATLPFYSAKAFSITIGGNAYVLTSITLIGRFKVGAAGAPMSSGDSTYTNAALVNKKVLVVADGLALPVDDGGAAVNWATTPVLRHVQKIYANNYITFIGNVGQDEIIEIYAYT